MANITKTVFVTAGGWRTLETFLNTSAKGVFSDPAGATIKVRFGVVFLGMDRQKKTLDGESTKTLVVSSGASLVRARMQMRVVRDSEVTYTLQLPGP